MSQKMIFIFHYIPSAVLHFSLFYFQLFLPISIPWLIFFLFPFIIPYHFLLFHSHCFFIFFFFYLIFSFSSFFLPFSFSFSLFFPSFHSFSILFIFFLLHSFYLFSTFIQIFFSFLHFLLHLFLPDILRILQENLCIIFKIWTDQESEK